MKQDDDGTLSIVSSCTPNLGGMPGRFRHGRTHINDLPFEVLVMIFEMVHSMSRRHIPPVLDPGPLEYWPEWDPFAHTAFPEALTLVCPLWAQTLARVSLFWTRLAISVNDQPTPPAVIFAFLTLSANRPIHIVISRRNDTFRDNDPLEKGRVAVAMRLLLPHIARWKTFHVDVMHGGSIPLPNIDIRGLAEKLIEFHVGCVEQDAIEPVDVQDGSRLNAPSLEVLDMCGCAFRDAYLFMPDFLPASIKSLYIQRYNSCAQRPQPPFPVHDLMACLHQLSQLDYLVLTNLAIDCFPHVPIDIPLQLHLPSVVEFNKISAPVLCEFYRGYGYRGPGFVHFNCCSVPRMLALNWSDTLSLADMDAAEDLRPLLVDWDDPINTRLIVDNCPRFDIELLREMSGANGARLCPHLETLLLDNCPHLTSRDLRRWAEARRKAHAARGFIGHHHPDFTVSSIKYLMVRSHEELAPEDKEWFCAHVPSIMWNGWSGGTDP